MMADDVVLICACPECGAGSQAGVLRCWLCGHALADVRPAPGTRPNRHIAETQNTFSLSSLFLVTTLVAVCLGVGTAAPGLGIALAIVATPAAIRTIVASRRRTSVGERMTVVEKLLTFASAIGVVLLVVLLAAVAGGAAFGAACFAISGSGGWDDLAVAVGACVGSGMGALAGLCAVAASPSFWGRPNGSKKTGP